MAAALPPGFGPCPPRFVELKRKIAESYGSGFEQQVTGAWREVLDELKGATENIANQGSEVCLRIIMRI